MPFHPSFVKKTQENSSNSISLIGFYAHRQRSGTFTCLYTHPPTPKKAYTILIFLAYTMTDGCYRRLVLPFTVKIYCDFYVLDSKNRIENQSEIVLAAVKASIVCMTK